MFEIIICDDFLISPASGNYTCGMYCLTSQGVFPGEDWIDFAHQPHERGDERDKLILLLRMRVLGFFLGKGMLLGQFVLTIDSLLTDFLLFQF